MLDVADSAREAIAWWAAAPESILPSWLPHASRLNVVLGCANIIAYLTAAFIFFPTILNGGSPFVANADEKLNALFGSSGCVQDLGDAPAAEQHLVDLGSGDGSVVRAATRLGGFGRASGYEINPGLVSFSRLRSAGRANEEFHMQSLWEAPLADADVVLVYLLPKFLMDLGLKLADELRDGAIVVSNAYQFPEGTPRLRLVREVPVATPFLNPDKSSSLWLYRVG